MSPVPDASEARRSDRRALQAVAAQFFANGAVYATVIPRLPAIRDQVDISIGTLGLVLTIGSIAALVGSLYAGRVVARFTSRKVMIYGAVLAIGAMPVVGFAQTPIVLVAGLVGLLFFDVFIDVAMNVQGSALSARRHAPVMNRLHGIWSLGTVVAGLGAVASLRAGMSTPVHLTTVGVILVVSLLLVAPWLLPVDADPTSVGQTGADLTRTHLTGTDPIRDDLTGADLGLGADRTEDDPTGADPIGDGLIGVELGSGADRTEDDPTGDDPTRTDLTGGDLSLGADSAGVDWSGDGLNLGRAGREVEPRGAEPPAGSPPARRFGLAALLLGAGGATAMAMEITNGDWASFRLADDLGTRPGVAALGFLAYTAGMTIGRLGGDWVQIRVGVTELIRAAAVVTGLGTVAATLIPSVGVSIIGFLVAGLGTSILFPQLYDRAAKWPGPPGSGFATMLIGQRGAGVLVPILVGSMADTEVLGVGAAMAIVVIPSSVIVYLTTLVRT